MSENLKQILDRMIKHLKTDRLPEEKIALCNSIKQMLLVEHQKVVQAPESYMSFKDYFQSTVDKWVEDRLQWVKDPLSKVRGDWMPQVFTNDEEISLFLRALAGPTDLQGVDDLGKMLRNVFGSIEDAVQTEKRRIQFALCFSNILWTGTYNRKGWQLVTDSEMQSRMTEMLKQGNDTAIRAWILSKTILEPFRKRCESLVGANP